MTKLDRLARSLPDARDLLDGLTKRNVKPTSSARLCLIAMHQKIGGAAAAS